MDKVCYILLATLSLISCHFERGAKKENLHGTKAVEIEEVLTVLNTVKDVEMWLKPDTFEARDSDKIVRCRFRNNTQYDIPLGPHFTVEKWDGDTWILLPFVKNLVFPDLLMHTLPPGESIDFDHDYRLSMCLADGAKEKGKYRMVVEIDVWIDYKLEKKFKTFAEFTVE